MQTSALKPIARLLTKELLIAVLLLLGVSLVVFFILYLAPGNPFATLAGKRAGSNWHQIQDNEPSGAWYAQYLHWLGRVVQGDLGHSTRSGLPVFNEVIKTGLNTAFLTIGSILLTLLLAVPIAVYTARKGLTAIGWGLTAGSYILAALPSFWFGYIVIYICIHQFGVFPLAFGADASQWRGIYFLLPVLVLGLCSGTLSEMVRYLREELSRVLTEDYIRTARAKGASIWKHALREGFVLPVTEMVAAKIPFVLGGAVVVEQVFNWPGMGRLAWQAAQDRDFPMIMGITLMAAVFVRTGSLIKQVVHICVNPRASQE